MQELQHVQATQHGGGALETKDPIFSLGIFPYPNFGSRHAYHSIQSCCCVAHKQEIVVAPKSLVHGSRIAIRIRQIRKNILQQTIVLENLCFTVADEESPLTAGEWATTKPLLLRLLLLLVLSTTRR
jgi:hypothetical protein